jgi:uncharacterized coiled-coil protein SlyX
VTEDAKNWVRENSTLVVFLIGQLVAFGTAGASTLAYMVKLESRVYTLETRGAEYSVARMNKIDERITVMEQRVESAAARLERVVDQFLKKPPN